MTPLRIPDRTPGFEPPRRVLNWRQALKLAGRAILDWLRSRQRATPPRRLPP